MNVRRTNFTLWTLAAVLGGAAGVCAAWAVLTPVVVDVELGTVARVTSRPASAPSSPDAALPLAAFERVWALDLRRPLGDVAAANATPTAPATAETPAPATASFVLLGTIGESLAMIRTSTGAVEVVGVGDTAQGAKVVSIRPQHIEIDLNGQRLTLAKPRESAE